jgi:large subunit ribosomal protein L22
MAKTKEKKFGKRKEKQVEQTAITVSATARYIRISARKLRLVADLVRGRQVADARTVLTFTPKQGAKVVDKLIASAVANAENNHELNGDDLYISSIYVNEGPTLKRWRARALGRASRINKRTCHITVEVTPGEEG